MELRQLRYFVRVVELGSISRAALDPVRAFWEMENRAKDPCTNSPRGVWGALDRARCLNGAVLS